jgi:hypothetical protein
MLESEGARWSLGEGATSARVGEETYLGGAFVMMSDLYGEYGDENGDYDGADEDD